MSNFDAKDIAAALADLISKLTLGKFLKWIITIVIILGIALLFFEHLFSSQFYYDKLDRQLGVLERAKEISENDSSVVKVVNNQIITILNQVESEKDNKTLWSLATFQLPRSMGNSFIVAFVSSIIFLLTIIVNWKEHNRNDIIIG